MRVRNKLVLETVSVLDRLQPFVEGFRLAYGRGKATSNSNLSGDSESYRLHNSHDWTGGKEKNALPYGALYNRLVDCR
jgi:hypothetical protein